jgi:hypothetical protein
MVGVQRKLRINIFIDLYVNHFSQRSTSLKVAITPIVVIDPTCDKLNKS